MLKIMRTILADIFRGLFLLFLKNKIIRFSSFKLKAIPFTGDVVAHWYSAPDFWGRGPGFESDISHNDPDALQDHYV